MGPTGVELHPPLSRPDATGLSSVQAAARLERDGPNEIPALGGHPIWRQLAGQLANFFAVMLWIAGALAFVAGLPQLGVAIFVVVVVNAAFAFAQEYRAERAAERLRDLLPRRATVIRDGVPVEVDASELVVGDAVMLAGGNRISADLRTEVAHALFLDTSTLTGESVPTPVDDGDPLFAGTFVTQGEGRATVVGTGGRTRLGGIARLAQAGERPTPPLALEIRRVARVISLVALGVGATFFLVSTVLGTAPVTGLVFAIGVTVALVPEALLPTVTLSLALGAQRMARSHALVRRLEAVETLGSTTFICTDKTGTLTANEMSVVEVWTPAGSARIAGDGYAPTAEIDVDPGVRAALSAAARAAVRCSTGVVVELDGRWVAQGDPLDAAIDALARRVDGPVDPERSTHGEQRRFPFDPRRRRMSVLLGDHLLVKGAPDAVLPRCRPPAGATETVDVMAARGLRVLAVADRTVVPGEPIEDVDHLERDLRLLGLLGLEDPPRPAAREAIAACRRAGIRLAMVTGDHPATAHAIARQTGLSPPDAPVVLGVELPADEDELGELIDRDGIVLSRIEPEDKLRIARALRRRGHVVAMTGDGVNDGPALHEADIGVAMGRTGTDVAREAADLVLLDDDFATIVTAVREGRAIFANARRFLTYHLTDNVAELTPFLVWALSGGRFPLALGVLQILALDIATDTLSAVALGAEPARPDAMDRPPARGRLFNRAVAIRAFGVLGPVEGMFGMAAFITTLLAHGWRPGSPFPDGVALATASGATFVTVVIAQTANAFACRSSVRPLWRLDILTNRLLLGGASIELMLAALFVAIPPLAATLGHAPPSWAGWAVALASAPAVVIVDALQKRAVRARSPRVRS